MTYYIKNPLIVVFTFIVLFITISCTPTQQTKNIEVDLEKRSPCLSEIHSNDSALISAYVFESSQNRELSEKKAEIRLYEVMTIKLQNEIIKQFKSNTTGELLIAEEMINKLTRYILFGNQSYLPPINCSTTFQENEKYQTHKTSFVNKSFITGRLRSILISDDQEIKEGIKIRNIEKLIQYYSK